MREGRDVDEALRQAAAVIVRLKTRVAEFEMQRDEPIAIVGIGCRYPGGVTDPETFWRLLDEGVDAVAEMPQDRWDADALYHPDPEMPGKMTTRSGGFLREIDHFDAGFFGISPREAVSLDPQQRLLLETSWESLERAGITAEQLVGSRTGVFIGLSYQEYGMLSSALERLDGHVVTGNLACVASGRISYVLGLQGPSMTVDTACSSSLVTVHLACQALRQGECSMALAGAATLMLTPAAFVEFSRLRGLAADGRCKSFSARADGVGWSEGCGIVVLERLSDARRNGHSVLAVIRGSAVNQDGRSNGLTAPNGPSQEAVIWQALAQARVKPSEVEYVECHGTGTPLGDPIEVQALGTVLAEGRDRSHPVVIGSVKSNLGHTQAAAGVAGLIKVVLSLQHGRIPKSLHFDEPNPHIAWNDLPVKVASEAMEWVSNGKMRIAGVSAFGLSGTNAHVVVEEAPDGVEGTAVTAAPRAAELVVVSAKSAEALVAVASRLAAHVQTHPEQALGDVAYSLATTRTCHQHRLALVARSREELVTGLEGALRAVVVSGLSLGRASEGRSKVVFVFPSQGSQWLGMGRELLAEEPVFRKALEECSAAIEVETGWSVLEELKSGAEKSRLKSIDVVQPTLFAMGVALAALWRWWGVEPDAVVGHGMGEVTAACVSGALSVADATKVVCRQSRLLKRICGRGAMALVQLAVKEAVTALSEYEGQLSIAVSDSRRLTLLSGNPVTLEEALLKLEARGVFCKRLKVDVAIHSPQVEVLREDVVSALADVLPRAPGVPMRSTVTGRWIGQGDLRAAYWADNLRQAVQFAEAVEGLLEEKHGILVEVSPHPVLLPALEELVSDTGVEGVVVGSLHRERPERASILASVGKLHVMGYPLRLERLYRDDHARVALPLYPWQRRRYWIETSALLARAGERAAEAATRTTATSHGSPNRAGGTPTHATRKDNISAFLRNALARFLEMNESEIDNDKSLLEMGSDSLVFVEAVQAIQQKFSVKITIRQLFEELTTLELLANYLDKNLPANAVFEGWPPAPSAAQPSDTDIPARTPSTSADVQPMPAHEGKDHGDAPGSIERIMEKQLAAMQELAQQQLAVLREVKNLPQIPPLERVRQATAAGLSSPADRVDSTIAAMQPWVPYQPLDPGSMEELPAPQQEYLNKFIVRYAERTKESKRLTQEHRGHHADLRAAMSFRLCTKEIRYPIIGVRSAGSKLWDVDGNRYVDFTMGFGVNLFGHNPAFIQQALREQLEKGVHVGPQSDLAGQVAALICESTGMERATFCNSGSEAVMVSLRVARASTGRSKIAVFAGAYHGISDGVLVSARMVEGRLQAVPMVPGITPGTVEDLVVLQYGSAQSLEILEKNIDQFAAVLVEPVQSRKPELQPAEFLHQLRDITKKAGVLLIFDETITGFRVHQRGAQGWFDVEADISTYGKVVGGGMPIGVVAGKAEAMSAIDGGVWHFGDSSVPSARTTLYSGTFCKHPLAMAAAYATLTEIKKVGPSLFNGLNDRTTVLVRRLNQCCREAGVPIEVVQFGSLFRLGGPLQLFAADVLDLLFYHLIHRGIYVWEGRNWFLSTAHTAEDLDLLVGVMEKSLQEMCEAGFFAGPGVASSQGRRVREKENSQQLHAASSRPSSDAQRDLFLLSQADTSASLSYNQALSARLLGPLQVHAVQLALESVASRHEALRTVFNESGDFQEVLPRVQIELEHVELAGGEAAEAEWMATEAQRPFELSGKPLWRVTLLRSGPQNHVLAVVVHHLIADGWSIGVLLHEIGSYYTAAVEHQEVTLPAPMQYKDYQSFFSAEFTRQRMTLAESYWLNELKDAPIWSLPLNRRRANSHRGNRIQLVLDPALQSQWMTLSSQLGATPFMTLLSVYQMLLAQVSGGHDIIVLVPVAGHAHMNSAHLIGDCSNLVPVRTRMSAEITFAECVKSVKSCLLNSGDHEFYPLAQLVRKLGTAQDPGRWPFFNIDRPLSAVKFSGLNIEAVSFPLFYTNFDFGLNITLFGGRMILAFEYRTELFDQTTIEQWSATFVELLQKIVANPGLSLGSLPAGPEQKPHVEDLTRVDEGSGFSYVAPSTPIEDVLTSIWEQVLGLKRISVTASFFDLGGHSLLATQIISRVRETFGVQVTLEPLFLEPTIAAFARHLETVIQNSPDGEQPKLVPVAHDQNLPLSFPQWRLWLIDRLEPGNTAYNMVGAARLNGILAMSTLEAVFNELILRQEALRIVFQLVEGEPTQRVQQPQPLRIEHVELSEVVEERIAEVILHEGQAFARQPFDLSIGPLIRVKVLKFGEKTHAIIVVVHHIVSDGWSMGILLREVGLMYQAFVAGEPSPLSALPIQFADYAVWQRSWLRGEALQRQLDYWLTLLQGVPAFLNLPVDHPRLQTPSFRGAHEPFAFTRESTELLRQFCRQERISPFMALLGAFSILLSRYSAQDDFVIGTDIANRNRLETEELVGCFVNLLPLRMILVGEPTFRDYLQRIRKQTLDAYMHQDVPFDHLIRALRPERKLTSTPLVQVLFVLQNAELPPLETPDLKMEMVPIYMETAEFELILSIDDEPEAYTGTVGYSTDLFERERIVAMISHLQTLLEQLVSGPERPLSSFSLFPQKDRLEFSDAGLSQKELDKLLLRLGQSSSGS
jgi:acyl transferase domain-containing protein/non-ribosomal peptide synthetase component F